jgi:hypothetical protein
MAQEKGRLLIRVGGPFVCALGLGIQNGVEGVPDLNQFFPAQDGMCAVYLVATEDLLGFNDNFEVAGGERLNGYCCVLAFGDED